MNNADVISSITQTLDGYKPLSARLHSFFQRYKNDFIEQPGNKALLIGSAVSLCAAVVGTSLTVAAVVACPPAVLLGSVAIAGAAQTAMSTNYLMGGILRPITTFFARQHFSPEREAGAILDVINDRVAKNPNFTASERQHLAFEVANLALFEHHKMLSDDNDGGQRFISDKHAQALEDTRQMVQQGLQGMLARVQQSVVNEPSKPQAATATGSALDNSEREELQRLREEVSRLREMADDPDDDDRPRMRM